VWIDHCTFHDCGDGSVDITHASDNFTLSWNNDHLTYSPAVEFGAIPAGVTVTNAEAMKTQ
jgi:hypothetical protein